MAMETDRSSRSGQDVEIPTSTDTNFDGEKLAVHRDNTTTNGNADTGLKRVFEGLSSDAIKIEPSFEEEERTDDRSGTGSVPSEDGDDLEVVSLNNDKPNVCFSPFHIVT